MSWRYENPGNLDEFIINGTTLANLPENKSKFGTAFYQTSRAKCFNLPATQEIWIKFDVYFDGTNRWRAYNKVVDHEITGITAQTNGMMTFFGANMGGNSTVYFSGICKPNTLQTVLLHMKAGASDGVVEAWVDGTKIHTYTGDANHGKDFADIYLQSDGAGTFFSNIIISDAEIELRENVSRNKLGLRENPLSFNREKILAGYNLDEISNSLFRYNDAVKSLADLLLYRIKIYEDSKQSTIQKFSSINLQSATKYVQNPNLTEEENELLAARQKFFSQSFKLGMEDVKNKILNVKAQIEKLEQRIDEINSGENSLVELQTLRCENRADFRFVLENFLNMISRATDKINFFDKNESIISSVVNSQARWSDDYKAFKTSMREELAAACRNESIDDENFAAWYDDWQVKRFAIEQRFLPLVEFAIKGNLIDAFDVILGSLHEYRDAVDKFYLNERKNIYQKFVFQAGGDLQEKFETESELYKLAEKLQRDLQEVIFKRDKTEERIFLLRWAEPLLNLPLDEISNFIRDRELNAIAEEVLNQFAELRRQNFEQYLADSKSYGEATQKREKEFNALIFRMRKDLHKS